MTILIIFWLLICFFIVLNTYIQNKRIGKLENYINKKKEIDKKTRELIKQAKEEIEKQKNILNAHQK